MYLGGLLKPFPDSKNTPTSSTERSIAQNKTLERAIPSSQIDRIPVSLAR